MKNKKMFGEYIALWSEMHSKELSDLLARAYWKALEPYSDEDCHTAFEKCSIECDWFPKIPHILERMPGNAPEGDQASLAWAEVDKAVRTIGNYSSVQFSDPVIHSVIQAMGGWHELCQCSNDEWKWKRVEFEKLYPTMKKKGDHDSYLLGDCEQSQRLNDRLDWVKPVAQVGDAKNTKLLTEGE